MTTTFNVVRVENLDETQFDVTNTDGRKKITIKKQDDIDLSNLPKVSWKDGTGILVKQDGALKQLVPARNLFQEVGVAMTGRKLSGLTGETYHVVVTVTNSGEATNEVTDLVITKPSLGTYRVENFTNSRSSGVTVEKLTDLTYKIKNLNSGGTAKIEFDVIPESAGSFQFGASVNPNNALDQQSNNNQSTITLSATKQGGLENDPTYKPTADCPYVTVTDIASNKVLNTGLPTRLAKRNGGSFVVDRLNVHHGDISNLRLRLENVDNVIVLNANSANLANSSYFANLSMPLLKNYKWGAGMSSISFSHSETDKYKKANPIDGRNSDTSFTFNKKTKEFIYTGNTKGLLILMKPSGRNCQWQPCFILSVYPHTVSKTPKCFLRVSSNSPNVNVQTTEKISEVNFSVNNGSYNDTVRAEYVESLSSTAIGANNVIINGNSDLEFYTNHYASGMRSTDLQFLRDIGASEVVQNVISEVRITSGSETTINITSCSSSTAKQSGNVSYTKNGTAPFVVTISDDATSDNSFVIDGVPFNIV